MELSRGSLGSSIHIENLRSKQVLAFSATVSNNLGTKYLAPLVMNLE